DGANFWGGSMVIGPNGDIIAQHQDADEALVLATLDLADVRRERLANPLLRDERLELTINELRRVSHERTRKPF
ncbi:MAG TPA: nitrilase-related carbon-nitrogen hydrolase, partial [Candidatus Acidoferrum sp.]|nr:nitrilase-related carbon-nitrogen hydrolase [Candidatus Acidoferrum sp.]